MKNESVGRRVFTHGIVPLVVISGSLAYVAHVFSFDSAGMVWGSVLLVLLFATLAAKAALFLAGRRPFGGDAMLGVLIVLAVKALEQSLAWGVCAPGDPWCSSSFQGLEYVTFAFLAIYHAPAMMGALAVYAGLIELGYAAGPAVLQAAADPEMVRMALPYVFGRFVFDLALGVGFGFFIRSERETRQYAVGELERLEREAQSFRLQDVVADPGVDVMNRAGREEAEKRAVQRLRQREYDIARFLKRTLRCYTAVIFRLDPVTGMLELRAFATDSRTVNLPVSIRPGQGPIGLIFKEGDFLQLGETSKPLSTLPYYGADDEGVYSFLGAPIIEDDLALGVIAVDSREIGVFGEEHRNTLEIAARMSRDAVQYEELRSRQETERLQLESMLNISKLVSEELEVNTMCKRVVDSVFRIVPYRVAAVVIWNPEAQQYRIEYAALGEGDQPVEAPEWKKYAFDQRADTVVTYAMKQTGPYLVDKYRRRDKSTRRPILAPELKTPDVDSVLAIPLLQQNQRVGCLVVAAMGDGVFQESERRMFGILANHFAASLLNASKHRATETRATTDMLTGLSNRVKYKEFYAAAIAGARKKKHPVSVLLTDIDHFKKINDTYGHPGGDAILKQVADILRNCTRDSDLPCRFGGEEFLIVSPETNRKDAVKLGERIRKTIEKFPFQLPDGRVVKVTMSIGVATFPDDGAREDSIPDKADQALYGAKEGGRNRVHSYCDMPGDQTTTWTQRDNAPDAPEPVPAGSDTVGTATTTKGGRTWRFG